ncbi:hypothetical protein AB0J52_26750, partial [Spirillospora sp. NPDC049652]
MTDLPNGSAGARMVQADRLYVGWRYAQVHQDPGPPPSEPEPVRPEGGRPAYPAEYGAARGLSADHLSGRPLRITAAGGAAFAALILVCAMTGVLPWSFAAAGLVACAGVLGITGTPLWRSRREARARIEAEAVRAERERAAREKERAAVARAHEDARRAWERKLSAYEAQREWYPVAVPPGVDRVD